MSNKLAGSHPEEHYVTATRKRMFLDRPTSHGGWPEGEYDPPVADRIYGWYKKMKMMPESDSAADEDEYIANEGTDMRKSDMGMKGMSGEQKRDTIKQHAGHRIGYRHDPESEALADEIADKLMSGEMQVSDLSQQPHLIRNVLSTVRSSGSYDLAKEIERLLRSDEGARTAGYVAQRGNHMRITESMLRRVIREELSRMNEADDPDDSKKKTAVETFFRTKSKEFPGQASKVKTSGVVESARSELKHKLLDLGVKQESIAATVKKFAPGGDDMGEGAAVAKIQ